MRARLLPATGTVGAISAEELLLDTEGPGTVVIPLSSDTVFQRAQPGMGGQAPDGETPPDMPDGTATDGAAPPDAPDGSVSASTAQETLSHEDISTGDTAAAEVGEDSIAASAILSSGGPGGAMGGSLPHRTAMTPPMSIRKTHMCPIAS